MEQEKQLAFLKKLLSLIQNKMFLKDYPEYEALLQHPMTITYKEQQLEKTLEEY